MTVNTPPSIIDIITIQARHITIHYTSHYKKQTDVRNKPDVQQTK